MWPGGELAQFKNKTLESGQTAALCQSAQGIYGPLKTDYTEAKYCFANTIIAGQSDAAAGVRDHFAALDAAGVDPVSGIWGKAKDSSQTCAVQVPKTWVVVTMLQGFARSAGSIPSLEFVGSLYSRLGACPNAVIVLVMLLVEEALCTSGRRDFSTRAEFLKKVAKSLPLCLVLALPEKRFIL